MSEKPTGVFVRLPLSDESASVMRNHIMSQILTTDALAHTLLAIGTPVTGGDIPVVTTLGTLRDPVPCVRQSDAQAQIAALEAEVGRLREENEHLYRVAYSGRGSVTQTIHSPTRFMESGTKGGAA